MNTIRHSQDEEPARDRRSLDAREGIDLWGTTTQSPTGVGCVVGGSRSGKGCDVNAGDLPGQDPKGTPAEVRVAIVAKASCGQDGTPVPAEQSRPTTGGAKGGRKANAGTDLEMVRYADDLVVLCCDAATGCGRLWKKSAGGWARRA